MLRLNEACSCAVPTHACNPTRRHRHRPAQHGGGLRDLPLPAARRRHESRPLPQPARQRRGGLLLPLTHRDALRRRSAPPRTLLPALSPHLSLQRPRTPPCTLPSLHIGASAHCCSVAPQTHLSGPRHQRASSQAPSSSSRPSHSSRGSSCCDGCPRRAAARSRRWRPSSSSWPTSSPSSPLFSTSKGRATPTAVGQRGNSGYGMHSISISLK